MKEIFDGIFIIGVRWSCYIIEFRSSWFSQRAKKIQKKIQVIIKNNQIIREKDNKRLRKIWIDNKRETKQLISSFSSRPSRAAAIAATSSSSSSRKKAYNLFEWWWILIVSRIICRVMDWAEIEREWEKIDLRLIGEKLN